MAPETAIHPQELRRLKDAFVAEFMMPEPAIVAVSCRVAEDGQPELAVTVRDDASVALPVHFRGIPVRALTGGLGQVAIGPRHPDE